MPPLCPVHPGLTGGHFATEADNEKKRKLAEFLKTMGEQKEKDSKYVQDLHQKIRATILEGAASLPDPHPHETITGRLDTSIPEVVQQARTTEFLAGYKAGVEAALKLIGAR